MQATFAGFQREDRLRPAVERSSPTFWLRRIQVVKELHAGNEYVVRDVSLRRGLNVLWAPPDVSREPKLFESGVAGHTAGKTTFCRLVRYVLGESTFASESTRKRIRDAFQTGWVLAEVVLADEVWVVGRPFAVGPHSFCANCPTIESLFTETERKDYKLFRERLAEVTLGELSSFQFPNGGAIGWDHLLPWLARDQECRFGDFLTWREPSSDSDTPGITVADRQFVVRAVTGLLGRDETEEQHRNARLLEEKKRAAEHEPLLAHHAKVEHARIQRILDIALPPPSSDLFGGKVDEELRRRSQVVDDRLVRLKADDPRVKLQQSLERAIGNDIRAGLEVGQLEDRLKQERGTLDQLNAGAAGDSQTAILASLPPPTGYCSVPMSIARERECPLALSAPLQFNGQAVQRTAAEEIENLRVVVGGLEVLVGEKRTTHATAAEEVNQARRTLLESSTKHQEAVAEVLAERAKLTQIQILAADAREAWQQAEASSAKIGSLESEIQASYSRQEELRKQTRDAIQKFSASFDFIIRALMGNEVEGKVDTSGRAVRLMMEQNGERESAALSTAKLLAFDLAALASGIEGRGHHPRFLLHDGPREADLAPDVYARLFLVIREFETQTAVDPPFQYIITTTTAPPDEFQNEPYLRLKLSGAPSTERLLRRDL